MQVLPMNKQELRTTAFAVAGSNYRRGKHAGRQDDAVWSMTCCYASTGYENPE